MVENIIRVKDSVILVGNEKSGKSLFILQLICALTSPQNFLDRYAIKYAYKVVYIQLEGELNDTQDRLKRMLKTQELCPDNFLFMFYPPLQMQDTNYCLDLQQKILKFWNGEKPDIVIFDPLYFSFTGSLSDDEVVRKFIGNIRSFKEALNCAVILIHHTHKQRWSNSGIVIDEGDEALFGSNFFKAWADHILMFMYDKRRNLRVLSCNTQRSGDIVRECTLKLIEPNPLYFEIIAEHISPTQDFAIIDLLRQNKYKIGLSREEITAHLGINNSTFYKSVKAPLAQGIILKSENSRPVIYRAIPKETTE